MRWLAVAAMLIVVGCGATSPSAEGVAQPTAAAQPTPSPIPTPTFQPTASPPSPSPTMTAVPTPTLAPTLAPTPTPLQAKVIFRFAGSGIRKSKAFTVPDWATSETLAYTFKCGSFGRGNFIVHVYSVEDPNLPLDYAVNDLAKSKTGSTELYDSGRLFLDVTSECSWSIKVIANP